VKTPTEIAQEQEAGLALLFQHGLDLALQMQADAMAAEAPEERARIARAFHSISRGVRQTAALRIRIAREAQRAEQDDQSQVVRLDVERAARRKAQVKATVERLIWTETESDDSAEALVDQLETLLDEDYLYGRFADGEVEAHIARLSHDLGLKTAPVEEDTAAEEYPRPTGAAGRARPPTPDHPFRSSA
jgi:hypothetical protein